MLLINKAANNPQTIWKIARNFFPNYKLGQISLFYNRDWIILFDCEWEEEI